MLRDVKYLAEIAQLINDHAGVEMYVCLAPKASAFSVAIRTFREKRRTSNRKRKLADTFSYCTFP